MIDIQTLLGDESEFLLGHECTCIRKQRLHLPGPDFVDRVVMNSDRGRKGPPYNLYHFLAWCNL